MRIKYMVYGKVEEVATVIDTARTENRFMSDTPNVADFTWMALDHENVQADILMEEGKSVPVAELEILSAEYPDLTFAVVNANGMVTLGVTKGLTQEV
jgi:hypothetical protein